MLVLNLLVAVFIFLAGYLTCAIRVALIFAEQWRKSDDD